MKTKNDNVYTHVSKMHPFLLRDAYMHKRGPCCRKMAGWLLQKVLDCRLLIKDRQQ